MFVLGLSGLTVSAFGANEVPPPIWFIIDNIGPNIVTAPDVITASPFDKQNRLATEAGIGTQEYFNARKEVAQKEFEKELLLADGNANKIENARTNLWNTLIQIDKDGLTQIAAQAQVEYDSMYEGTVQFFDKRAGILSDLDVPGPLTIPPSA